jgi:hypothetical protein
MLTCVILASFAAIVGVLTDRQLRGQFNDEVRANSEQLAQNIKLKWIGNSGNLKCNQEVRLKDYASAEHVQNRNSPRPACCCARRTRCGSRA